MSNTQRPTGPQKKATSFRMIICIYLILSLSTLALIWYGDFLVEPLAAIPLAFILGGILFCMGCAAGGKNISWEFRHENTLKFYLNFPGVAVGIALFVYVISRESLGAIGYVMGVGYGLGWTLLCAAQIASRWWDESSAIVAIAYILGFILFFTGASLFLFDLIIE